MANNDRKNAITLVAVSTLRYIGDSLPQLSERMLRSYSVREIDGVSYVERLDVHTHAVDDFAPNKLGIWSLPVPNGKRVDVHYAHVMIEPTHNVIEAYERAIASGVFSADEIAMIHNEMADDSAVVKTKNEQIKQLSAATAELAAAAAARELEIEQLKAQLAAREQADADAAAAAESKRGKRSAS